MKYELVGRWRRIHYRQHSLYRIYGLKILSVIYHDRDKFCHKYHHILHVFKTQFLFWTSDTCAEVLKGQDLVMKQIDNIYGCHLNSWSISSLCEFWTKWFICMVFCDMYRASCTWNYVSDSYKREFANIQSLHSCSEGVFVFTLTFVLWFHRGSSVSPVCHVSH